ncbi:MAG TPA: hypothetical protein VLS49_07410 [Usitatibacter sp.]|nr:hypothetical protein [Usitatibacter sp.]
MAREELKPTPRGELDGDPALREAAERTRDSLDGRAIFVRFVIAPLNADSIRFEQSFSVDGGQTRELNRVADDVRVRAPVNG